MKAYKAECRPYSDFRIAGVEMTQSEYRGEVTKLFVSPIVQNEIHRLLNEYAEKLVRLTRTTEETAFARGAIEALEKILELSNSPKKKVNVL